MELRDIEYFAVVAEHGHLGRASEALGLSPTALSKSLRRLEKAMQAKLVSRTPKGVVLTAEGDALLARVRGLRLSLEDVAREIADLSQGRAGQLRVGTGPGFASHFLPAAFEVLVKDAPKVRTKVVVAGRGDAVADLRNGKLDLVIAEIRAADGQDLVQEHLFDDEFIVYTSVNHRLAKRKRVTLADLVEERWALSTSDTPLWLRINQAFERGGLPPPRIAIETASTVLRLPLVASSDLLGYSSKSAVMRGAPHLNFVELYVKELAYTRHTGVLYRKNAYISPAARRFVEILKATAKEIAGKP